MKAELQARPSVCQCTPFDAEPDFDLDYLTELIQNEYVHGREAPVIKLELPRAQTPP